MSILVTGGAGYIGSHTVKELYRQRRDTVVYDSLIKGHRQSVLDVPLVIGDIRDKEKLAWVLTKYRVDSVIHFAAHSLVGESMRQPGEYYQNNVCGTMSLLDSLLQAEIKHIVFSSTAAVYGEPHENPITETAAKIPTNVYGKTKLIIENMLADYEQAYGLNYVALRYFNACGADESGLLGEDHTPETHLIPIVLSAALGIREHVQIFGTDYPTPDGTCIRDYIHVNDLAQAHILALEALKSGLPSQTYNLGNGQGFSVREVIKMAETVTGINIKTLAAERRAGDPSILVASADKIIRELGWQPRYTNLKDIITTAWNWHSRFPQGYTEQ